MRSFILASIVALAFAATPAFEHVFEPKNEYHYKFDGLILSGLPTTQRTDMSQSRISARARLQSIDDRHIHLQLIHIKMAASHMPESEEQYPELRSLETREISDEYKTLLELPVRAQIKNGLVSNIHFDAEDQEWSKNVKRSVLNMISFVEQKPTEELEYKMESDEEFQTFFVNEKTIEGDCQVAYTINRENKKTIITKTVNFNKCSMRPQAIYGNQYTEELTQQEQEKLESFKPQTVYTYTLEGELLKEVEVRSIYSHNVNGQEVMRTETRSKLAHEETHEINNQIKKVTGHPEEIIYSNKWEAMVEMFFKNGVNDELKTSPFKDFPTERKMTLLREILENVQDDQKNGQETVHQFARLVRLLRTTTDVELEKIHEKYYDDKEENVQTLIDQALAIAGTKYTIQHLLKHLEVTREESPVKAALLLKSIQETPFPSQEIAKMLLNFCDSIQEYDDLVKQTAILSLGAVVRGVVSRNVQKYQIFPEDSVSYKKKILGALLAKLRDSKNTVEKMLWIKALGNAGIDIAVNEINNIINDHRQPLAIRREAVDSLRLLDSVMPLKLQRVLLPLYKNQRNPQEIRMATLWRLIQTRPSQSVLAQVVSQMEKESNQQVQQFTYKLLKQFAKSTNPMYKQLASDCADVLSFTRFESQRTSPFDSDVAQLSLFARNILSGAEIDHVAVYSKNSIIPSELHTSLDTLFGGNWNRYLIQFGFTQQNFVKYLYNCVRKIKEESHLKSWTRADRLSTEKLTLLQKLAQQLNIKSRQQTAQEKEIFVMPYLRYKNMDYIVLPMTDVEIEEIIRTVYLALSKENKEKDVKMSGRYTHAAYFYETIRKVPTTLGLPLTITGKLPTLAKFEGKLSSESSKTPATLEIEALPTISATHIFEMRMIVPLFEQGIKSIQSVNTVTPFNLQWHLDHLSKEIETTWNIPEKQQLRIHVATRPVVYLRYPGYSKNEYVEAEEKTLTVPQLKKMTQEIDEQFNQFGLEITTRGNVLRRWALENVLFAEQDYELLIKNSNKKPAVFSTLFNYRVTEKTKLNIDVEANFGSMLKLGGQSDANREALNNLDEYLAPWSKVLKMTFTVRAPENKSVKFENIVQLDPRHGFDNELNVVCNGEQEWALQNKMVVIYPHGVTSMRDLQTKPISEVMMNMKTRWGLTKNQKKEEIKMTAKLGQSKEQKQYQRWLKRQTDLSGDDILIESSSLNQLNVLTQYKLDRYTQQQFHALISRLGWYLGQYWTVSTEQQDNKENQINMKLTVDPYTRQYVNMSIETPEQLIQLFNAEVPRLRLPFTAKSTLREQYRNNGQMCSVTPKKVLTFDEMTYSAPLTNCWSVIAKDCSENPKFVVLAKKDSEEPTNLIVKYINDEGETFVFSKVNGDYLVNGETIDTEGDLSSPNFKIEIVDSSLVYDYDRYVNIQYNGEYVYASMKQDTRYEGDVAVCGLCGNNDNEMNNEMITAEDLETDDLEKFHRSYMLKDDECKIEEDVVSDKINYKSFSRLVRPSYDMEDEEDEEDDNSKPVANNLVKRTEVKEFAHRICFSLEGVPACRRDYDEQETVEQKVKFTCLPRHDSEARRFLKQARQQEILELKKYPVSFVEPITVPTQCGYAY